MRNLNGPRRKVQLSHVKQLLKKVSKLATAYNSTALSRLLADYEASQDAKALALIKKVSPVAWRHVHLNGHHTLCRSRQAIDLDAIVAGLDFA